MELNANILRIERISPSDGAGLRTVVFFKGCPLRCAWCSTPESQSAATEVYWQRERCLSCGRCAGVCPEGALSIVTPPVMSGDNAPASCSGSSDAASGTAAGGSGSPDAASDAAAGGPGSSDPASDAAAGGPGSSDPAFGRPVIRIDRSKCKSCLACVKACPGRALQFYGKLMTVRQVMREILKDEIFYFHSGGGVTLSGGDVLCYPDFAEALLMECKENAINTSAELAMYGDYSRIQKLLPWLDSFFIDLKLMDSAKHEQWTGLRNDRILENIRRAASECRKDAIHVRVPLIWDVNDDPGNILETARFCEALPNCAELEFLPYHRLGQHAYRQLERPYALEHLPTMTREDALEKIQCILGQKWKFPIRISGEEIST